MKIDGVNDTLAPYSLDFGKPVLQRCSHNDGSEVPVFRNGDESGRTLAHLRGVRV